MGESRAVETGRRTEPGAELVWRRAGARFVLELWRIPRHDLRLALLRVGGRSAVIVRRRDARELRQALGDLLELELEEQG